MAHLWPRDAETGLAAGLGAHCGRTRLWPGASLLLGVATDYDPHCQLCQAAEVYVGGRLYYPLGQHPDDLARRG